MAKSLSKVCKLNPSTLSKFSLLTFVIWHPYLHRERTRHLQSLCELVQKKNEETQGLCKYIWLCLGSSFLNQNRYHKHMTAMLCVPCAESTNFTH